MRGEKVNLWQTAPIHKGSPPHARGKGYMQYDGRNSAGITPACAGKSQQTDKIFPPTEDHPRMRGEKDLQLKAECQQEGSPPHARGKD